VAQYGAFVLIYTGAGKQARERAAQQQEGEWVAGPRWHAGWRRHVLSRARYPEFAGREFWLNVNDLAWFEEVREGGEHMMPQGPAGATAAAHT
jgi:hypothetical protein